MPLAKALPVCFACACALLNAPSVFGAGEDLDPPSSYEGRSVQQIRFEPELQPLLRAELNRVMTIQTGAPLRLADVREAIGRLYSTGRYSYIEADAEPAGDGVDLVFRTRDQWFVGPVEVRGKVGAPPNEGQLANASRLNLGEPMADEDVDAAVKNLKDLLQRNGLYLASVDPSVERDSEHQEVAVTFDVKSGKRARFVLPVVIGDTRIPPEELAKSAKYKGWWFFRWKYATEENTQLGLQAVRKKYDGADRLIADVQLDRMDYLADENRVRPVIRADGGPKIEIKSQGAKVSGKTLQRYVPVFSQGTANRDLLVRGAGNLRDYFQNKGYFEVQVDFQTKQIDPDHEQITYVIAPGERHKLVQVAVSGNRYFKTDDIRERMFLQPSGRLRLRHGRYSTGFLERDVEAIKSLYASNGFRDVAVNPAVVDDYQGAKGHVSVTMNIVEGPQYKVAGIDLAGITRPDKEQIRSRLSSIPGEPFSASNVAMDRDYIVGLYYSEGYPDVAFDWRIAPGPGPDEVSLRYIITEGEPRYIRDVLLSGLHATRMRLVRPNVLVKPGEPLSWTQMAFMQRRLYDLGVFDKVDMAIQNPDGNTQNKYVLYHFTEGHRYYLALGAGAQFAKIGGSSTSLDNPSGSNGFAARGSLELSRLNMWGLGHSLNFKSAISNLDRRVSLNYLAPRYRNVEGRNISLTALYENTRDVLTFQARRLEGAVQMSQKISRPTTVFWRYSWRDVKVDTSTLKIDRLLIPLASQAARIGMFSANLVQDRRDDPADAHRGIYNSADLGLANHFFGGNKNFLRFLGRNSYYKTFRSFYVIASNTELGIIRPYSVAGIDPSQYIPFPERFFGGGSNSHRGFSYNQAGPRDLITGFPLGGNALLFHSTELRFPLLGDNIGGVIFHDMGNVYPNTSSISFRVHQRDLTDFDYMVHAAGFGIRYRTPIGPVRVDLAYSFNPPSFNGLKGTYQDLITNHATKALQNGSHFQFFISIGQAF